MVFDKLASHDVSMHMIG